MNRHAPWFAVGCLILVTFVGLSGTARGFEASNTTLTPVSGITARASVATAATTKDNSATSAPTNPATTAATTQAKSEAAQSSPSAASKPEAPATPLSERLSTFRTWLWTGLADLAFKRWDSPVFEPPFWNTTLSGLRIVLPLALAFLLVCNWLVQRAFGNVPKPLVDKAALGFMVAGFITYYGAFNPNIRNGGLYQVNAYYQQFFEAKYHSELDASWLFDCTIAAEKQLGRSQQLAQRNVRSYTSPEDVKVAGLTLGVEHPDECVSRFSEERWSAFKADIAAFMKQVDPKVWSKLQSERRAVLSPTWLTLVPTLTPNLPSESAFRWSAVFQLAFHAGTLVAVAAGFGFVPAAVTSIVWGCQPFMPFDSGVELFQSLWLEAFICGLCALVKRRWVLGTLAVSLGVALQPLALLAVIGGGVAIARPLLSKPGRAKPFPRLLGPGLVLCTSVFLAAGCVSSSYARYASALEFQASLPYPTDVGMGTLFAISGPTRYQVLRQDALPDPARPWAKVRAQRLSETRAFTWAAMGSLAAASLVLAWLSASLWLSVALGLLPCALAVQPLAGCIGFLALAVCTYRRTDLWPALLTATSAAAFLSGHAVFVDDRSTISSALLLLTTLTVVAALFPRLTRTRSHVPQPATVS